MKYTPQEELIGAFDTVNTLFQSLNIEPCLCAGQTRGGSRAQFC